MNVAISGVDAIMRDGLPIHDLQMETADGEVVQLSQGGPMVTLIIPSNLSSESLRGTGSLT